MIAIQSATNLSDRRRWFGLVCLSCSFLRFGVQAATVSGQVVPATLPDGSSAGATIGVFAAGNTGSLVGQGTSTTTDAQGKFQLELESGGWSIRLDHKAAARRGILSPDVALAVSESDAVVNLTLEVFQPTIEVHGILKSDQGDTIPNVSFTLSTILDLGGYSVLATTDQDGEFRALLFAGEWRISAFGLPSEFQRPPSQTVELSENTSLEFVASTGGPRLVISPETLPSATAGEPYSVTLTAEGGSRLHVWSVAEGSALPPNLELTEFGGKISGVPTQSGAHRFTIVANTFSGSVTGEQDFILNVARDDTAPTIRTTTPNRVVNVRDNSVVAIHFSEPMRKIRPTADRPEPFAIRWEAGPFSSVTEIPVGDLIIDWNESGDTLYLSHRSGFPLGRQKWILNPSELPVEPDSPPRIPFQDTSGNLLAPDTNQSFTVSSLRRVLSEDGELIREFRDVEQVWVVKSQSYDDTEDGTLLRLGSFNTSIHLPRETWTTVRSAQVTRPDGDRRAVSYFGFEEAGNLLNFSSGPFPQIDTFDEQYPVGQYTVTLDTIRDGVLSLPLRINNLDYPTEHKVEGFCSVASSGSSPSFILAFNNLSSEPSIDMTQLVITERRSTKVINFNETSGGVFESIVHGNRRRFVIPPETLELGRNYSGYIRRVRFSDENHSYTGARVVSALATVTQFELDTQGVIQCGTAVNLVHFAPIVDNVIGESRPSQPGDSLPPVASVTTDDSMPGMITLVGGSTVALSPSTDCVLDQSNPATQGTILTLNSGSVAVTIDAIDREIGPIRIDTARASILVGPGMFVIEHESGESGATVVNVTSGEATIQRFDSMAEPIAVAAGTTIEIGPAEMLPPQLLIERTLDNLITLSWKSNSATWRLESTETLSSESAWTAVSDAVTQEGDTFMLRIQPSQEGRYFRLEPAANP